jgi:hypothetical protein
VRVTDFHIGLLALACVFGGALTGMFLGRVLPPHHLNDDTRSVITLALGTVSVLSALVIGLLKWRCSCVRCPCPPRSS